MISFRSKFLRLIFIMKWSWIYLTIYNIFFRPSRILSATLKLWWQYSSFMQMRWCYVDIFLRFLLDFCILFCVFLHWNPFDWRLFIKPRFFSGATSYAKGAKIIWMKTNTEKLICVYTTLILEMKAIAWVWMSCTQILNQRITCVHY